MASFSTRAMALCLVLLSLMAAVSDADVSKFYIGPASITAQDTYITDTAAQCVGDNSTSDQIIYPPGGCVPVEVDLGIAAACVPPEGLIYNILAPDGQNIVFGPIYLQDDTNTTGPLLLSLLWGSYNLTFFVASPYGTTLPCGIEALYQVIPCTIIGFQDISTGLSIQNAQATDAQYGMPQSDGLRWAWYALQANNSQYNSSVAQPWYTGSSTQYHQHAYWQLTLDPQRKGATKFVSLVVVTLPYLAGRAPDYSNDYTGNYTTRSTNHNLQVSIGNNPFYGGVRTPCTLFVAYPGYDYTLAAQLIYQCPPNVASKYVVITVQQTVNTTSLPPGANPDEYGTRLALHYVQVFGPYAPTYVANRP